MARCARTIGESLPRRRAWADITSDEEEEAALPAVWVLWGGSYFVWLPKKKGLKQKQTWKKTRWLYRKRNVFFFFVVGKMRTAGFC